MNKEVGLAARAADRYMGGRLAGRSSSNATTSAGVHIPAATSDADNQPSGQIGFNYKATTYQRATGAKKEKYGKTPAVRLTTQRYVPQRQKQGCREPPDRQKKKRPVQDKSGTRTRDRLLSLALSKHIAEADIGNNDDKGRRQQAGKWDHRRVDSRQLHRLTF